MIVEIEHALDAGVVDDGELPNNFAQFLDERGLTPVRRLDHPNADLLATHPIPSGIHHEKRGLLDLVEQFVSNPEHVADHSPSPVRSGIQAKAIDPTRIRAAIMATLGVSIAFAYCGAIPRKYATWLAA